MKTGKLACNYAIIRFLPYPETEEFVNVGVALACPSAHYFDFRIETQRRRVTGFFPELNKSVFVQGRNHFRQEMERVRRFMDRSSNERILDFAAQEFNRAFIDIVRPRESIFRFSGIGTHLAEQPESALDELFCYYVERQFAQRKEFQEAEMTRRLQQVFRHAHVSGYRNGWLGNERYEVPFPLLRATADDDHDFRAIKALDLAKKDPTSITEHGDVWLAKLGHMKRMNYDVNRVLFAVQLPHEEPLNIQAAREMVDHIKSEGAQVSLIDESERITDFARAV